MLRKTQFLTDPQYVTIGRRYGSDAIATEASRASALWQRDLDQLAGYGYGRNMREMFEADRAAHTELRTARPDAVAGKKMAVITRDKHVSAGWAWMDRATAMLGVLARNDQKLATTLNAAVPDDDSNLATGIQAVSKLMADNKARLPADAHVKERLAEVKDLSTALHSSPGDLTSAKAQTVADTAQIDLYDGKLYVWMRDLHRAARSAIRNGHLNAQINEYSFHDIKRSGSPAAPPDPPAPPAGPTPNKPPVVPTP